MTVISIWTEDEGKKSGKCTRTWIAFQIVNDAVSSFRLVRVGVVLVQFKKLRARPHIWLPLFWWSETSSKWFAEIGDCDDFQNRTQRIIWLTSRARRIWLITKLVKGTYLNLIMGLAIPLILKMSFFLISNSNCSLSMIRTTQQRLWTVLDS